MVEFYLHSKIHIYGVVQHGVDFAFTFTIEVGGGFHRKPFIALML
jgi:hypothetical protein